MNWVMNKLTPICIENDAESRTCQQEGGEASPNFGHWKFEDPGQKKDDPEVRQKPAIYKKRCPQSQGCQSPISPVLEKKPSSKST